VDSGREHLAAVPRGFRGGCLIFCRKFSPLPAVAVCLLVRLRCGVGWGWVVGVGGGVCVLCGFC
jgi:hypothetical protein